MSNRITNIEYVQPFGVTREANILNINFSNAMTSYVGNSIFLSKKVEAQKFRQFLNLKNKWKSDILFVSSGSIIISNSAYKDIIGFGPIAVPWIIRELKKNNDHWFYALEKITGENPIKEENIGRVDEMRNDWIDWASKNDYL
jgi:hypothetical protein